MVGAAGSVADLIEERIGGRYRIVEHIGSGGMGTVYRVIDEPNDRSLALKLLAAANHRSNPEKAKLRFQREFHTVARLRHPRVVEVYDYGIDRLGPFYTMELLDGRDLKEMGTSEPQTACRLLRDVAAALAFLHDRKLLHRDLKGRNVRCTGDGRAKLIDFGVLASFGPSREIAGTPPYIAPESFHGLPLDHRTDLFGLGALAYWLLTGRHAFPAKNILELERLWRARPGPPSSIAPQVPGELDELVMSMISLDRMGRPASAVDVIDRLTAIGDLPPLDERGAAQGYLASAPLIGRRREINRLRALQADAVEGRGSAAVIDGISGVGKSRLLTELGFEAQLSGALVLRAGGEDADRGSYDIIRTLARELIEAAPEEASAHAWELSGTLVHAVPELRRALGPITATTPSDPAEDRLKLQSALVDWFVAVARDRPLTALVDDVQRCDEASAAVLASLAHAAANERIVVATTLRLGEKVRAPAAIAALRDAAKPIRLTGLDESEVQELVRALFGDVPNTGRLASWMNRVAGGAPLYCTELARHLVDRGTVRLVEGSWVIPEEIESGETPAGLAEAMEARLEGLEPRARALAEALSVYGGEFSIDQVALVSEEEEREDLFDDLDELLFNEVLVGSEEHFQFRHDSIREALLRRLDEARRRRLHLRVGETLLAEGADDAAREVEVGWHLVRGGERRRGAELLLSGGRRHYEAQCLVDAIPPLEAALEIYVAEGEPIWRRLEIREMLLTGGMLFDRDTALRHAKPVVEGYGRYSGMRLVGKLAPFLGKRLSLVAGLLASLARWLVTWPFRRGPLPLKTLPSFFMDTASASSVYGLTLDVHGAREMERVLAPIHVPKDRIPYGTYLAAQQYTLLAEGRLATMRAVASQSLEILENDHKTPIHEIPRAIATAGQHFWIVLASVMEQSTRHVAELQELEALSSRFFRARFLANVAKILYHRMRGEESRAGELESELELVYVRIGPLWFSRSLVPTFSTIAYGVVGDAVGLKRTVERLGSRVAEGDPVEPFLHLAHGEYYRLRGKLDESEEALRRTIESAEERPSLAWAAAPGALAETLLAAGRLEEAREAARRAIEINGSPEWEQPILRLRGERALALIEAASGDLAGAASRLDGALEEAYKTLCTALIGALHEARARVALLAEDRPSFELHNQATAVCFKATENPVLISRAQKLAQLELPAGGSAAQARVVGLDAMTVSFTPALAQALSSVTGPGERAHRILELVLGETSATDGFLYVRGAGGGIELLANTDLEPSRDLEDEVRVLLAADAGGEVPTVASDPRKRSKHRVYLLHHGSGAPPVGAIVLVQGALELEDPPSELLGEIASVIERAENPTVAAD